MNVWRLTAAGNLMKTEEEAQPGENLRRVRVTKLFVNAEDAAILRGERHVKYPLVPGRFAVGMIADDGGSALFPKNARVLLHAYLPAEDTGVEKCSFFEEEFRIPGRTSDGYMRDFVFAAEENMTPLPDAVNDEKALLLSYVALAQATVDTLDVKRGEHIAVIGANLPGLLLSRLLIYRQAAPILIDSDRARLEFARSRGVYYTAPTDDQLMEFVGTVTGGRLADGVVFIPGAGLDDLELPLRVCAPGRHVALCGLGSDDLALDLNTVVRKGLTIHGVLDGTEELETAINLVANKAVDLSAFRFTMHSMADIDELCGTLGTNNAVDELDIINFI